MPGGNVTKFATVATEQGMCLAAAVAVGGVELAVGESAWFAFCVPAPLVLGFVLSRFRRAGRPVRPRQLVRSGAIYVVGFVAYSGAIVLAQAAVGPIANVWRVAGAGCFAWALGVVIVFAPGGAGVREAAYAALVGRAVPSSLGVAGSLVARLVLTAAEMAVLLVLVAPPAPPPRGGPGGEAGRDRSATGGRRGAGPRLARNVHRRRRDRASGRGPPGPPPPGAVRRNDHQRVA